MTTHTVLQAEMVDGLERASQADRVKQYSLGKILLVWAAAAAPMGVLGWIVAPALSRGSDNPGMVRLGVLTIGLIWQFVLVMILLYREAGNLHWSTIR